MQFYLNEFDRDTIRIAAQKRGITEVELMRRVASMFKMLDDTDHGNVAITMGDKLVGLVAGL